MKPLSMIVALAVLAVWSVSAAAQSPQPQQPPAAITLAELEQLALENNPTTRQAQAAVDAARGRARQAGAWPNPTIGYTGEEIKTRSDVDPRGEHGFFVEQTIPLGGKLRLGQDVFNRATQAAEARVDLQRQRILSSVRTLFYEVLTAERRVEVRERLATLASEAVGVTAQLFNVGAADRPDYLEQQIESRRVQLALNDAMNLAFARRQQLALLVGRREIADRRLAGSIDEAIPELEREATVRSLLERSPQIRAARVEVERAAAVTARARKETFPDLFLRGGAAHNKERGEDTRQPIGWEGALEAGISIPLFNRNQGGVFAARSEEAAARADVQRLELSLQSQIAMEFATYLTAQRAAETYRTEILPQAEEAYRLYLARYREMGAAYPQVLVAQRTLFEMSADYVDSLDEAWRSALRLQGFLAGDGLQRPQNVGDAGGDRDDMRWSGRGRER